MLEGLGRLEEAETHLRAALGVFERVLGHEDYEVASTLTSLAVVVYRRRGPTDAEPLLRRALAIKERLLGRHHPDLAILLANLAGLARERDDEREAAADYRRALALLEPAVEADHPVLAAVRRGLAAQGASVNARSGRGRVRPAEIEHPCYSRFPCAEGPTG